MLCPELVLLVGPLVNQIFSAGCQLSKTCPSALGALYQNCKHKEKPNLNFEVCVSVKRESRKVLHFMPQSDWDGE